MIQINHRSCFNVHNINIGYPDTQLNPCMDNIFEWKYTQPFTDNGKIPLRSIYSGTNSVKWHFHFPCIIYPYFFNKMYTYCYIFLSKQNARLQRKERRWWWRPEWGRKDAASERDVRVRRVPHALAPRHCINGNAQYRQGCDGHS